MMKAIVQEKYGSPDVLKMKEVEKPTPGDEEVLVKVHAASVNDWDWAYLTGTSLVNRLMNGLLKPQTPILGCDIAGVVESVGSQVKKLKPGDKVYGDLCEDGFGGFAEYVCAHENSLALKPAGMTFQQAAAIPQAAMLAVQGLRDHWKMEPGQKILINGAGGGVGTFGVQIAKLSGVEITGVDSTDKLELMLSLGFDHVIDYTQEDFTKTGQRYDMILDNKMNRSIFAYNRALNPGGKYIVAGGSNFWIFLTSMMAPFINAMSKRKFHLLLLKPNKDLDYMNELFEAGNVKPVIDGPYQLEEVPEAFRYFGEGKHKGKIIINVVQE